MSRPKATNRIPMATVVTAHEPTCASVAPPSALLTAASTVVKRTAGTPRRGGSRMPAPTAASTNISANDGTSVSVSVVASASARPVRTSTRAMSSYVTGRHAASRNTIANATMPTAAPAISRPEGSWLERSAIGIASHSRAEPMKHRRRLTLWLAVQ
ncbi:MAG TPA: hypothetical protein VH231_03560 [Solirubrobacteraceae bacterium]|nr:hypothetical protein [Solirubrobacteraceae bacterium]